VFVGGQRSPGIIGEAQPVPKTVVSIEQASLLLAVYQYCLLVLVVGQGLRPEEFR